MDGEISTDEVNDLLEAETDESVRIVDIRNETSFAHSHIPGSENVPFQELTSRVDEFADADRIITVCPHGKASVQAAQLIGSYEGSADATVESMAGGLEEYGLKYGLVKDTADDAAASESGPESPF
ncbi:rhodanese-like domain-containing protein [Natronolimnobius sp. AArcel1]|uniref:rhodanese-like domain-containing protein n=1 Tax=Natronolimnobius sp. AArcel1 TaxID=1679093 RepID=UPI0013ED7FF1|nr:rhodanese-like domain-containing protein [Natronolimnobius sp. AArcel1]NGM70306.1 rhodanese-like domain-containing protein [Natronolimnobius sp. AArcel1]